jgi:hypothetical protein
MNCPDASVMRTIPEPPLIAVLDDPLSTLWGRLSPAW